MNSIRNLIPTISKVQRRTIRCLPTHPPVLTLRRGFVVGPKVQFQRISLNMQEHCLDKPDVENFTIPGAKVFDRYFDLPLGENRFFLHRAFSRAALRLIRVDAGSIRQC